MANRRPTLYTGVTNDLARRVYQHKHNLVPGSFTSRYGLHSLVYCEVLDTIQQAIIHEKQIKDMNRADKLSIIRRMNPTFRDLYGEILDSARMTPGLGQILESFRDGTPQDDGLKEGRHSGTPRLQNLHNPPLTARVCQINHN